MLWHMHLAVWVTVGTSCTYVIYCLWWSQSCLSLSWDNYSQTSIPIQLLDWANETVHWVSCDYSLSQQRNDKPTLLLYYTIILKAWVSPCLHVLKLQEWIYGTFFLLLWSLGPSFLYWIKILEFWLESLGLSLLGKVLSFDCLNCISVILSDIQ